MKKITKDAIKAERKDYKKWHVLAMIYLQNFFFFPFVVLRWHKEGAGRNDMERPV